MRRPRVYDAKDLAIDMVETFKDRPMERREELDFDWPSSMQNVGVSEAVAYSSDKWKKKRGDNEMYKHLAESRNWALVRPGLLKDYYYPNKNWPVCGPKVSLAAMPMPEEVAILGLFEEIDLQLYSSKDMKLPDDEDDGVVKVTIRHGMLGGSYIRWSEVGDRDDQPFLFVYTRASGVCIVVFGEELDVEKDGITG